MKTNIKTILMLICALFALNTALVSCEDYLDKEPDSTVSPDDAFVNFRNFQGFVEESTIVSPIKRNVTGVRRGIGAMMRSLIPRPTAE